MNNHEPTSIALSLMASCQKRFPPVRKGALFLVVVLLAGITLGACSTTPLLPYTTNTPPLVLVPASEAGVRDKRGRFREIFCQILETRGSTLPDYRPCDDALTRLGVEPAGTGERVKFGQSRRGLVAAMVPGLGSDCFADWLDLKHTVAKHIRQFGYDQIVLSVDTLSSSAKNARRIRDAILRMPPDGGEPRLVLFGYSKGIVDILEAVVSYPEIHQQIAAVVSVSGAVGGSPLANDADESQLDLLRQWPGAQCPAGDGGAIESLRPAIRQSWLAKHSLPDDLPYYSLVTFPRPEYISTVLKPSYDKLSKVDSRNDGQLLFYDQIIPGSTLLGYVNADHWALAVPISRSHRLLGSTIVEHNDFPREALVEALLRFIEWDVAATEH